MHGLNVVAAFVLALPAIHARADDKHQSIPPNPLYVQECSACHLAYPPALLTAPDWRWVMAALDRHYGANATLDEKTRREIDAYLQTNAGAAAKVGAGGMAPHRNEPPRLTATALFQRKHREVPQVEWTHAKVKSPANCGACHTRAAEGSYREREIRLPDGRRWED